MRMNLRAARKRLASILKLRQFCYLPNVRTYEHCHSVFVAMPSSWENLMTDFGHMTMEVTTYGLGAWFESDRHEFQNSRRRGSTLL
jgi:hypothetical protein